WIRRDLSFLLPPFVSPRLIWPSPLPEAQPDQVVPETTEASGETEVASTFVHLHVHTQFSVLQSASDIPGLIRTAVDMKMPAVAMTDHGNMMGAFQFVSAAHKNNIKPIVGCEFNVCRNHADKTSQDNGFQIPMLALNKEGYHNLAKLSSRAHTHGFYYVPRIDRELLLGYAENIIVLTGGLYGEVPWKILNEGEQKAEEAFVWWKETFGDRFYVELMRHGLEEEVHVNNTLLGFCKKYNVKFIAANSSYYTKQEDAEVQDALVCIREGEYVSKPSRYIGKRGREFRFGLPNDQYFFKSPEQMTLLFRDLPEAIENTLALAERCESYKLSRDILLPRFDLPESFISEMMAEGKEANENEFLRHLTLKGAAVRYGELTSEVRDRLEFELQTITQAGYAGYFLIVQDFCNRAREMGVSVGPGRGSAAGSAVAYCTGITNVDPIRYQLLFERFLNPERVSMPDIDIDFDDKGRDLVIDYVRRKYGEHMVAQIITFGTMGGKSAIRDAGRVLELPLPDTDRLAKLMPDGIDLSDILSLDNKGLSDKLGAAGMPDALRLREIAASDTPESRVVKLASKLEGNVRNTGIHACGVIITPQEITNYVPVATAKDSDMWCTQFDNSVVESAGLLKMDFLGLSTLTLIKDTLQIIRERRGDVIDMDTVPLDDVKTYELFQKGHTMGTFQYESEGMQKYMKELKPTVFDDLIAMNALFRPGPMEYIPSFIRRKAGTEEITYDLPEMEEFLKDTYGITVYQEQVMLLSQKLAGFSKGDADVLRKAMGKKQKDVLDKMKGKFLDGALSRGHAEEKLQKIWTDWEAFASYAFNKSHSTCYAWIGYQTAWL
ncbi:MAG: DNA polymerase III subunit alpha, partial [Flavobacteriales bacterium]|nr:DNA polymerase III subunit alpha [Flavobacteriales bacterium]